MTNEEYTKLSDAIDKAEESTIPFIIPSDDEIVIAGDANKTQINPYDFKIRFRVPEEKDGNIHLVVKEVEYKNVFIKPRNDAEIVKLGTDLMPFFRKVDEDGNIVKYTKEEIYSILTELSDEIYSRMYNLVGKVVGVSPDLVEYMTLDSVFTACMNIFNQYPEAVNEMEAFFRTDSAQIALR